MSVAARAILFSTLILSCWGAGCTVTSDMPRDAATGDVPRVACSASTPVTCMGSTEQRCGSDGFVTSSTNCGETSRLCVAELGCVVCTPGQGRCDGESLLRCRDDGSGYDPVRTCERANGDVCSAGLVDCVNACAEAERTNSYIGCEYWPTTVANIVDQEAFAFAVVVANPQVDAVEVEVSRGNVFSVTRTIAAGAIEAIELPWVPELSDPNASAIVFGGAYRLRSSQPVTVYQFNPLEYQAGANTFSFTNDASLLLPTHVLTGNYLVQAFPTNLQHTDATTDILGGPVPASTSQTSGFFAATAASEGTQEVTIRFTAPTRAEAGGTVRRYAAGETGTFMLSQGDVLQILSDAPSTCTDLDSEIVPVAGGLAQSTMHYCETGRPFDLTGTDIRSTGRLSVIGGHACSFVPMNRWACDHLEEGLFPLEAWGRNAILGVTRPLRTEPNLVRVLSGTDGNQITFEPSSVHEGVTLNRGEYVEFETRESFRATGTGAISISQFLVGQDYDGLGSSGSGASGDPSLSLAIPTEQFRLNYTFLAPTTYAESYVNVIAPSDSGDVRLDGVAVSGFRSIGSTGFQLAQVPISGGRHTIEASFGFGITVYGFGRYTSYMVPGGLDLNAINIPF